jgi:hypothetical protein
MSNKNSVPSLALPEGVFSPWIADEVRGLFNRVRLLLRNRHGREIRAAEEGLHAIFAEEISELEEDAFEDAERGEAEGRAWVRHSHPRLLKVRINQIDIRGQRDFPAARWSEYFAILALERLSSAIEAAKDDFEATGDASAAAQAKRLGNSFFQYLDCQEALTIGEMLATEDDARAQAREDGKRELRSLNAMRAIRKRREPLTELKRDLIRFYLDREDKRVAPTVRAFRKTVPDERIKACKIREIEYSEPIRPPIPM